MDDCEKQSFEVLRESGKFEDQEKELTTLGPKWRVQQVRRRASAFLDIFTVMAGRVLLVNSGATCEGGTQPPIPKPGFRSDRNFRYCFDVLHCHDYGGVQVMSACLDVECSSTQYKVLSVMATTFLLVALMALGYAGVMFSDSQLPQATKDRFTLGGVVLFDLMAVLLVWLLSHEDLVKIRMRVRA
ncbi:hypothetical protein BSKO_12184 [Bryopsis sp. KO-2023]|nr:hypothetical protein BSKO_12184 [Bryopsis sp. KO-2023]